MATQVRDIVLKILAGIHAGAQTPLRDGAYLIGSGDDCDIVLTDDGIAEVHARLAVDEGNCTLEVKAHPVYVDGHATRADAVSLHARHVVTVGLAFFTIGVSSTPWEKIPLPTLEKTDEDPTAEPTKGSDSSDTASQTADSDDKERGRGENTIAPPSFPGADPSSPGTGKALETPAPASMAPSRRTIGAGLAVGIAILVAWPAYQWLSPPPAPVIKPVPAVTTIRDILHKLGPSYDGITLTPDGEGTVTIGGYVADTALYRHFLEELKKSRIEAGGHVRLRVSISESMAEWIRDDLSARGFHVAVKDQGQGKFEISGIVDHPEKMREALASIRKQIPHIRNIEEHIISTQHIVDVVHSELSHQGVDGSVTIQGQDARIEASGFLDEKDFTLWRKIVDALRHMYGSILTVQDRVENVPGLKLPLRSVVKGPHSFVVLNGKGYFHEGMELPNGFRLDTIAQDYLLLSRDGHTYKYVYGGYDNG